MLKLYKKIIKGGMGLVIVITMFGITPAMGGPLTLKGDWGQITASGYLREYLSMNLQDAFPRDNSNDRYQLSMARTALQLYLDGNVGEIGFHFVGREVREIQTPYLHRLSNYGAAQGKSLIKDYYDQDRIREFYLDIPLSLIGISHSSLRLGKQQVVFGSTDFFHALDQVEGYDLSWRTFLVPENEDVRKPLVMANFMFGIPKLQGQLQLLLIPGFANQSEQFGNTYDLFGGRWANQPNKGVDFIGGALPVLPYNYDTKDANGEAFEGGVRWTGIAGGVNYSLVYLHQHNPDPVANSFANPYKAAPRGTQFVNSVFGDLIYPQINLVGGTANVYSNWANAVFSTEVAYTFNKPYNVGRDPLKTCDTTGALTGGIPGLCGVKTFDTVQVMLRMDKTNMHWAQDLLHSFAPPFFSVQVFDTFIPGMHKSDDVVSLVGYAAELPRNQLIATMILGWGYKHNTINPQIAGGVDGTHGGGFVIPSVQFVYGDHIRVKLEADLFFDSGHNISGGNSGGTYLFGYFHNNDQLFLRATYLF